MGPRDGGTTTPSDGSTTVPSTDTQCHFGFQCAPRHCIDGCCRDAVGGACLPARPPCQGDDECTTNEGGIRRCIEGACRDYCTGTQVRCASDAICRYADGGPQVCFERGEVFRFCARTANCPQGFDCIDADCVRR